MLVWREQFGRNLPEYEGPAFGETEDAKAIGSVALDFSRHFARIDAGNETEGDGILIRVKGYPLHAALVVAPGWMLHAEMHTDTCLSRYRDFSWERRIHGFYRYIDGRDPPPR
jgi:cell wall-associated NlpC family hydrolase